MPVGHLGAKYSSDVVPKRDSSKYETGSTSSSFSSSSSALSHVGGSHPHPPQGTANGGALRQVFSLENGDVTATTNGCSPPSFSSSAKTVLIVKCTDTSINAFNQAIATQRKHDVSSASITFKSGGGLINVPVDMGNGEAVMRGLEFKTSKMDNVLQCILQPKNSSSSSKLINLGEISQQVRMNATEDIFLQTKLKMNQVEEDSKKISTKTLDDSFGKNKLGGINKRKTTKPSVSSANKFAALLPSSSSSSSCSSQQRGIRIQQQQNASPTNEVSLPASAGVNDTAAAPNCRLGATTSATAPLLPPSGGSCTNLSPSRFSSSVSRGAKSRMENGPVSNSSLGSSSNSNSPLHRLTPSSHPVAGGSNSSSSRSCSPLFGASLNPPVTSGAHSQGQGQPPAVGPSAASGFTDRCSLTTSLDIPVAQTNDSKTGAAEKPFAQMKHNHRNDSHAQITHFSLNSSSPPKCVGGGSEGNHNNNKKHQQQLTSVTSSSTSSSSSPLRPAQSSLLSPPNSTTTTTNNSSHTNNSSISYGLKDHIIHLLALVDSDSDSGGMTVSSLTFRLKSVCKLQSVQYHSVMTALQEVAQVAKREPALTYSLKHPHLVIPTLHPALYPHYSPAQRALVQQKIESITAAASSQAHQTSTIPSELCQEEGGSGEATPSSLLFSQTPPDDSSRNHSPSHPQTFSQGGTTAAENAHKLDAYAANSRFSNANSASMLSPPVQCDEQRPTEQMDFKSLIEKTQRKRSVPDDDRGAKGRHGQGQGQGTPNASEGVKRPNERSATGSSSDNNSKRFRVNQSQDELSVNLGHHQREKDLTSQLDGDDTTSRKCGPNKGPVSSLAMPASVFGGSPSLAEDEEHEDSMMCETDPRTDHELSPSKDEMMEDESEDMGGSFAQCITNCTYCRHDPLKNLATLKNELRSIVSREEYYAMVGQFKQEYYGEFLPLRKKVTETKKTFRQLKHDFDAAKLQYCKVDDPGNRKQLEQLARNVIRVHEDIMHRKDFLRTNHDCNQLHNRLSVMMTRLKNFRDRELLLSTATSPNCRQGDTQPMTSSVVDFQAKTPPIGPTHQPIESSAEATTHGSGHREKSRHSAKSSSSMSKHNHHHSSHNKRRPGGGSDVGSSEGKRKECNVSAN